MKIQSSFFFIIFKEKYIERDGGGSKDITAVAQLDIFDILPKKKMKFSLHEIFHR
jgi:hypothetical protein